MTTPHKMFLPFIVMAAKDVQLSHKALNQPLAGELSVGIYRFELLL